MRPLPYAALRKFVEIEGWAAKGKARRSGATGDHYQYTLTLTTGEVLATRISHGTGQYDDPKLVASILRNQLKVTEEDFWRCVEHGVLPPRPQPPGPPVTGPVLDAKLVRNLLRRVGLTQAEIATLSKAEAVARWQEWLTSHPDAGS
jgi:hypothetical protein